MKILFFLTLFATAFLASLNSYAAQINVPQTFGNGDVLPTVSDFTGETVFCTACILNGWLGQAALNAGEEGVGDHALLIDRTGPNPAGFHVAAYEKYVPNDPNFVGNYIAAGVTDVRFRARHSGTGDSVALRVYLFDTFDDGVDPDNVDWAISNTTVTIANTATTWQMYTISLAASNFVAGAASYDPPRHTVEDILSAVAQFGFRHDPLGTGPRIPARVSAAVYFDDIELIGAPVPVPAAVWLFGSAIGLLGWMRRKTA